MGAPQFLQRPRNASQVISGRFKYQGMEYLQCGQWDRGVMMLMSSGSRWMHTFKKLPVMQPSTKKHDDQKWKGRRDQSIVARPESTAENKIPEADRSPLVRPWTVDCKL